MADEKQGIGAKLKARLASARERYPWLDHLIRMNEHYGTVQGNLLAGAVTYFGFLSFFPILALGFAVIGYVSLAYSDARDSMVAAIESIFPGIVSPTDQEGKISLDQIESAKATAGIIGFAGVLYSGLGWLSGLRTALQGAFVVPDFKKPNFVMGKLGDLVALAILGAVLILSVGLSGAAQGTTDKILDFLGLDIGGIGSVLVWAIGFSLGLAASTVLLFVMFKLLGEPRVSNGPLWRGALLGAVGFELLKLLVIYVLGGVGGSAFAPLAIAITLVVWINYFSRLVIYGASWAFTAEVSAPTQVAVAEADVVATAPTVVSPGTAASDKTVGGSIDPGSAAAGAMAGAVVATFIARRRIRTSRAPRR